MTPKRPRFVRSRFITTGRWLCCGASGGWNGVFASDGAQKLRSQYCWHGRQKNDPKVHWPTSCLSKFYLTNMLVLIMFFSLRFRFGRTQTRRCSHQRDNLAARSACWAVVSTPQFKLSWRETVEGSLSHVRRAVRVRIGVALAETAETSRTVPLSTRSLSWCHSTGGALAG
jgi:hypothetical protein